MPNKDNGPRFSESLQFSRSLLSVLTYRRGGQRPTLPALSPTEWKAWAARLYANEVARWADVPFRSCPRDKAVAATGTAWRVQWQVNHTWQRESLWRRKATAAALGLMAVERAHDDEGSWGLLAEQWRDRYTAAPGPDLPDGPRLAEHVAHVRTLEKCAAASLINARECEEIDD